MRRDYIRLGRNFVLSLGGEGIQSGFHFILNLVLIRVLPAYDFGIFAIAFVIGGIALSYGNGVVSVPAAVHMPRFKSPGAVHYQDVVFGSVALLFSILTGLIVAVGLIATIGHPYEAALGGAFVALWTLRNHVRTALFARHKLPSATLSDLTYTASGIVLVAVALWLDQEGERVSSVLGALALANLIATGVALRALRRVRISFRRSIWRQYGTIRSDVLWSLFGATTWNIQSQALTFLAAAIAGPAAYAPVAAGLVLFSPLRPAINAFVNVFRPHFTVALKEKRYRRLRVTMATVSAIILLACVVAGVGIAVLWPLLDEYIFAHKFDYASMPLIITLCGLIAATYLTYNAPLALIQAAGHFKPIALATTCGALVGLCSVTLLLLVTSVAWSLTGVLAGEIACALYLWVTAIRILRQRTAPTWQAPVSGLAEART